MGIIAVLLLTLQDPWAGAREEPAVSVSLDARVLWASVWGQASAHNSFTGFQQGESLDFRDDFNLDTGALLDLRFAVRLGGDHQIAIRSLYGSFESETTLTRTFEYNDNIFQAGEHAKTGLDLDFRDGAYLYRVLRGPTTLWIGAGGRWAYLNAGISGSTLDSAGSMEAQKAFFPMLQVAVEHRLSPHFTLAADLTGGPAAIAALFRLPSDGRFVEARFSIAWTLGEAFRVELGGDVLWMGLTAQGHESDGHWADNRSELLLLAPSLGLRLDF